MSTLVRDALSSRHNTLLLCCWASVVYYYLLHGSSDLRGEVLVQRVDGRRGEETIVYYDTHAMIYILHSP